MRVKVGDYWYEPSEGQPIMVELTTDDKANISNMTECDKRYAVFGDETTLSLEERKAWVCA